MRVYSSDVSVAWNTSSDAIPIGVQRSDGYVVSFVCSSGTCTPHTDVAMKLTPSASGFTITDEKNRSETYTTAGALTSIAWPDGYKQTMAYDASGTLTSITDSYSRQLSFAYTNGLLTTVTTPDGSSITYAYDTSNRLTSVTYPGGAVRAYQYANPKYLFALTGVIDENNAAYATIGYDSQGRANSTALAGGANSYSFVYNSNLTTTVTDPRGFVRTYSYQLLQGRPKIVGISGAACDGCNAGSSTSYDSAGYLQSSTDFNNQVTNYTYDDASGLETQRIEAGGTATQRTTNTVWNTALRVPNQRSVVNASSAIESLTKWAYNARGQVLSRCEIDPAASGASTYICGSSTNAPSGVRQTSYTYCESAGVSAGTCPLVGLVLTVDGSRTDVSDVIAYTYYQTTDTSGCATLGGTCHYLGDLLQITNALGQSTTFISYDKNGRVTRQSDVNGTLTDLTYSPRGWLLTRTVHVNADGSSSANDATTTFAYDNVGQVTKITQPDGAYLAYSYDAAHRLTDITDNFSNTIHYTLDAAGNRTAETTKDPSGTLTRSLSRQYDQLNHLTKTLNAASVAVQTYQNPAEAPPSGITYTNGYDGNGNAIYSVDSNGVGGEQQVDPLNRLIKTLQDHAGTGSTANTSTQYAYDARDNLRSVTDPDGLVTGYTYDGLNNLTQLQSPDTGTSGYTYDAAGNRITQTDARGLTATYTYDALNRLTGIAYPTSSLNVTYSYDQAATGCFNSGRLTQLTDSSGSTVYCYDRRGNVLSKQQTVGAVVSTVTYTYTPADRLQSLTYPSGAIVTYTRNVLGQITQVAYQTSATATAQILISNAGYLPFGPLSQITFGNGRTLSKSYDQDYAIDKVVSSDANGLIVDATVDGLGNLTSASNTVGAASPTQSYQYDSLYRLTNIASPTTTIESFTYNKTGDRTDDTTSAGTTAYTYPSPLTTHRLQSVGTNARSYDANGNTQTLPAGTLTYDARNRLVGLNTAATTNGTPQATYDYNGKGERVTKSVGTVGGTFTATMFVYGEGGQLLGEYANAGTKEYIYLDGIPVSIATTAAQLYYVEADQLGTPREVIQPGMTTATDTIVWKWDYFGSAFGTHAPNPQALTVNLRFPGQYFDAETSFNYNYFRDYEPATGRYIESDPIGLEGGLGTYVYVYNEPLNFIDPSGLLCTYSQTTGNMSCTDSNGRVYVTCTGYAGRGAGLNNPNAQNQQNTGPLPQGTYTVGAPVNGTHLGPGARALTPSPTNTMFGRGGFYIHPDNRRQNHTASEGCIIDQNNCRSQIPTGETLQVVP